MYVKYRPPRSSSSKEPLRRDSLCHSVSLQSDVSFSTNRNREVELQQSASKQKHKMIEMDEEIRRLRNKLQAQTNKTEAAQEEVRSIKERLSPMKKEHAQVSEEKRMLEMQLATYTYLERQHQETLKEVEDLRQQNASLVDTPEGEMYRENARDNTIKLVEAQERIDEYIFT